MVTEFEYLALADLAYLDFSEYNDKEGIISLKDIINENKNNFKIQRKSTINRWEIYKKYIGDWKIVKGYNPKQLLTKTKSHLTLEEEQFYAVAFQSPDKSEIVIAYRGTDGNNIIDDSGIEISVLNLDIDFIGEHVVTNRKIAVANPGRQFKLAEQFYNDVITNEDYEFEKISFTGHSLGGGLAQYAAVMSSLENKYQEPTFINEGSSLYVDNVKEAVTWNSIGIKSFSEIVGYEFLDNNGVALLQRLKEKLGDEVRPLVIKEKYESLVDRISDYFEELGYIKNGKIKKEFLNDKNRVDIKKLKKAVDDFRLKEALRAVDIPDVLWSHWNDYGIFDSYKRIKDRLEMKMRFAAYYEGGDKFKGQVINYIISKDLTGNLAQHIGDTYIIDKDIVKQDSGNLLPDITQLRSFAKYHGFDVIVPYCLLKEKGNIGNPKNRKRKLARKGDVTTTLSYDYLRSIIKTIILDVTENGSNLEELKELYLKYKTANKKKTEKLFQNNLIKICKAVLLNSVQQQDHKLDEEIEQTIEKDLDEEWIKFSRGGIRAAAKDFLFGNDIEGEAKLLLTIYNKLKYQLIVDESNIQYKLDTEILAHLCNMKKQDKKKLWRWFSSGNIKELLLGTEGVKQEEATVYHNTTINNASQEIKLKITAPLNKHTLFGSSKLEEKTCSRADPFEFVMGMGEIDILDQESDPQTEIIINEVQLGEKIKIQEEYLNNLKENESNYYTTEIYEEVFAEKEFKVEYHLEPNFSQPEENQLIVYYGPSATAEGVTEFTTEELNKVEINNFVNGDYGIYLPRVHRVEGSLEEEIIDDEIRELDYYDIYDHRQQENSKTGGDGLEITLPDGEQKLLGQELEFENEVELRDNKLKYEFKDKFGFYYGYTPETATVEINYSYGMSFANNQQYFSKYGGKVIVDNYQYGDLGLKFIVPEDVLYGSRRRYDLEDEVVNYATVLYGSRCLVAQMDRSDCEYKFTAGSSGFWQHNNTVKEESNGSGKVLLKFSKQDYRDAASLLSTAKVDKNNQETVCLSGNKIIFTYLKELGNLVINFGDYNNALLINGFENGDYGLNHAKFKFQDSRGQSADQYIFYNGESTPTYKREDGGASSFNGVVMESDGSGKILLELFGQLHNLAELNFKQLPKLKRIANPDGNTYGIKTFYEVKVKKHKTATLDCEYRQNCYDDKYDLIIKYGSNQQWKIRIKKFRNGDYGIKLPLNRIDEIAGANSKFDAEKRDQLICHG